jgi:glycosyltransferase involved in cell wall biosynthesis
MDASLTHAWLKNCFQDNREKPGAGMPISIVMPTYNRLEYIKQAIDSVLAQSYTDWELIITDDGSNDGTREYLSTLTDSRIKIHFQSTNLGQFGNLNFGFSQASNEIAQILCDDDYFVDNDALKRLVDEWSTLPPEVSLLRTGHQFDANSELSRFEGSSIPRIVSPEKSDLYFGVFGCIAGSISNVSVRTEAVRAAGWFRTDLPYSGDFEFWSRLARTRPICLSKIRVAMVREHAGQVGATMNNQGEAMPQMRFILERIYASLVSKGYSPTLLRLMFTINYVSQHRYRGVKALLRGNGTYLQVVSRELDRSNFSLGSGLGWLVFFGSLGGKMFRIPVAKRLLDSEPRPA